MVPRLLLVENDPRLGQAAAQLLRYAGWEVAWVPEHWLAFAASEGIFWDAPEYRFTELERAAWMRLVERGIDGELTVRQMLQRLPVKWTPPQQL